MTRRITDTATPRNTRRAAVTVLTAAAALTAVAVVTAPPADAVPRPTTCASIDADHPGGVAKKRTRAARVDRATVDPRLYRTLKALDGNRDGIACGPREWSTDTTRVTVPTIHVTVEHRDGLIVTTTRTVDEHGTVTITTTAVLNPDA